MKHFVSIIISMAFTGFVWAGGCASPKDFDTCKNIVIASAKKGNHPYFEKLNTPWEQFTPDAQYDLMNGFGKTVMSLFLNKEIESHSEAVTMFIYGDADISPTMFGIVNGKYVRVPESAVRDVTGTVKLPNSKEYGTPVRAIRFEIKGGLWAAVFSFNKAEFARIKALEFCSLNPASLFFPAKSADPAQKLSPAIWLKEAQVQAILDPRAKPEYTAAFVYK